MIIHVDISKKRTKNADSEKKKKKVSPSNTDTSVHGHFNKPIDYVENNNDVNKANTNPTENVVVKPAETTIDPHFKPFGKTSVETPKKPTSGPISEPLVEPPTKYNDETHDKENPSENFVMVSSPPVDMPVFDTYVIEILDRSLDSSKDARDENSQNQEP